MRPSSSLSLIWISRATTSPLPLPPLSRRGALGIGDGDHRNLDPEVSSPPLLSLSLYLLFFLPHACPPFTLLARAPAPTQPAAARRRGGPALPSPWRRPGPALPGPRRHPPPRPRPLLARRRPSLAPCPPGAASGPRRGPRRLGPRRLGPLRASFWPLAWFAWPRASPFTASAFPRAQPALAGIIFRW
jgi:hypothetical protein